MTPASAEQPTDQSDAGQDGGEGRSVARPLIALGLAAGAGLLAYLLAKQLLGREEPADRAEHLVTACESLLDQLQESIAQFHEGVAAASRRQ